MLLGREQATSVPLVPGCAPCLRPVGFFFLRPRLTCGASDDGGADERPRPLEAVGATLVMRFRRVAPHERRSTTTVSKLCRTESAELAALPPPMRPLPRPSEVAGEGSAPFAPLGLFQAAVIGWTRTGGGASARTTSPCASHDSFAALPSPAPPGERFLRRRRPS